MNHFSRVTDRSRGFTQSRRDCVNLSGWRARLTKFLPTALAAAGQLWILSASIVSGWAQARVGTDVHLQSSDVAVLESMASRADFACQVTSEKPSLGFDLRFHVDYRATVPVKVLADAGGSLHVLMRVASAANTGEPVYFAQQFAVPAVPPGTKGEALLAGGFDVGPGLYKVGWIMHDARERVCSSHWEVEVKPRHREQHIPLTLEPDTIVERIDSTSEDELPTEPTTQPLHIKVLLNLSPATPRQSILKPEDAAVLLSMLRSITREPGINRFSLVAFNMWKQMIVARQDIAGKIDFAALAQAAQAPTNATVNYRHLQEPKSDVHFVTKLLASELGIRPASPDAIIIVGPKVSLQQKVPLRLLRNSGAASCPIFYLNYNPNPVDSPWPDTIGSALKAYTGALKYNIAFPVTWEPPCGIYCPGSGNCLRAQVDHQGSN